MNKSFTAKRKLWKVMKICAAQGMIAILICGMAIAHDDHAQLLEKKIVVSVKDVSLKHALKEIGAAGDVKISYRNDQYKEELNELVSVESNGRSLGDVLDLLLAPYKIKYKVIEKRQSIVFELRDDKEALPEEAYDQVPDLKSGAKIPMITGKVKDAVTQQPMAGVNVIIKGTTRGTTTDVDGGFSLEASEDEVIVFSFIGYTSFETSPGKRNVIDVALQEDTKNLDEVVVNVGYWEVKQKEQTGNVSRLTSDQIQKQNVSNPLQAMQGRMPGVYIQQTTGMPGGGFNIQVRGQNSLRDGSDGGVNGNLPLYLVDGVPFTSTSLTSSAISSAIAGGNPLSSINPSDIESIEVLKDADATAIYGARGANGVVLITTKHAKAGKTKLDVDLYQGIGQVPHSMELLTTPQYLTMRREGFRNDGAIPDITNAPDLVAWDTTRTTDWQKELIGGTAHITNGTMTLSGGNAGTQFSLSGTYYRESTVFPGANSFQRGTGRMFIHHQSSDNRLMMTASANYSVSGSDISSTDFTNLAVTLAPNAPALYDVNGNLNWENSTWTNPLAALKRKYKNKIENLVTSASASYEILKGLSVKSNFGYTSMTVDEIGTNPVTSLDPQYAPTQKGFSNFGDAKLNTWIIEPMADYNRRIGRGNFTALIGSTFQQSLQQNKYIEAYGYATDALLENLAAATTLFVSENNQSVYKYSATYARLNYNLNEKYIINLTGRRDASSRFGPGNRLATFGAVGMAWLFSNENFLKNSQFFNFGKLRISYGSAGSDAIGNYQFLETFAVTRYPYGSVGGLALNSLANPDYSWETNKKFEAGLEISILKERINFSASFYSNRSTGQLVGLPLPIMTGQSSVQFNLPATVQNSGWEFQITSTNIKHSRFEWSSSLNITIPDNKLLEFPNLEMFPAYALRYDVGNSVYTYKGYQFKGVNTETGLYQVVDQNNDGSYSEGTDYLGLKKNTQFCYGGIQNTFKYANFQLDFLLQFVTQNGFSYQRAFGLPGWQLNQPVEVMQRWQRENDVSHVQRFSATDPTSDVGSAYYLTTASDNIIQDASFIRLKNLSLSWQFPSKWTTNSVLKEGRIFIQGQNLITMTDYVGLDPETQNSFALPPLRTISIGFHVTL